MSGEVIGAGSLKLVTAYSSSRTLRGEIETALAPHVRPRDVRHLHGDVFVVYTEADNATIRDWLAPLLGDGDSLFVVEFEHWSGRGGAIDRAWLLRRGH